MIAYIFANLTFVFSSIFALSLIFYLGLIVCVLNMEGKLMLPSQDLKSLEESKQNVIKYNENISNNVDLYNSFRGLESELNNVSYLTSYNKKVKKDIFYLRTIFYLGIFSFLYRIFVPTSYFLGDFTMSLYLIDLIENLRVCLILIALCGFMFYLITTVVCLAENGDLRLFNRREEKEEVEYRRTMLDVALREDPNNDLLIESKTNSLNNAIEKYKNAFKRVFLMKLILVITILSGLLLIFIPTKEVLLALG